MRVCGPFEGLVTEVTLFPTPSRESLKRMHLACRHLPVQCRSIAQAGQHLCAGNIRAMATTSNIIIFAIVLALALGMAGLIYSVIWALFRAIFK